MKLGKSQREKEPTRVASVAAFNPDGLLLFGLRNDTDKWTLPGGHFEPGEEPIEAARRELEEETGLKGENFEFLGVGEADKDLHIYCFRCLVVGDPSGSEDPDEECSEWKWCEPNDMPEEVMGNLHSKKNITLRLLGIQEGDVDEPLTKKDIVTTKPFPVQHYSTTPGLTELDPAFQGSGAAGQERNRTKRIPRTYYYTRPGVPEAHVASAAHLYHAELPKGTRLYDMGNDSLGLMTGKWRQTKQGMMYDAPDRDKAEKKLKAMGYHGYHNYGVKDALVYFHKLPARNITQKSEELQKGFLATAALAGSLAMGGALHAPEAPEKPQMNEVAQQKMPAWTPEELHPDLIPVAHLESSFGQNMAHASDPNGEFHTAFGALGFKPSTAHEEYTKSKFMNQKYPGLSSPEEFVKKFKGDNKFYNLLASAHFARLKARHGDPQKAAYAWRHGSTACANASDDDIKNDLYVQKYTAMQLHGKQGQLQKSEDPLEAMLHHENPHERILALKNKNVTPYHLRLALQDEDPEVRAFAAKHPKMTEPMIHEALQHEDIHTRKAALSRPDLTPEHIKAVLFDPDLQTLAVLHPRCTEEQRSMVSDHHLTPPGLRHELLAKTMGYLKYPRLGLNQIPSTPMIRSPEAHQEIAAVGTKNPDLNTVMSHGYVRYNMRRQTATPGHRQLFSMSVKTGPGLLGAISHETQHGIYSKLKQTYGKEAGHRIVASTLAALDPDEHEHLKKITGWATRGYGDLSHPEERIAFLHNYLQDPMWRAKAHKAMKILGHRNAEKISHDMAKRIFQKLKIRAENLTPQEVGVILKSEMDTIQDWVRAKVDGTQVEQFVKSDPAVGYDSTYEDQLGMHSKFEAFLKAGKFLAHAEPDLALFRQALISGHDLDEAVLVSVGLETNNKNRRALLAVVSLQNGELVKAEPVHMTHEVQALMPDGAEVADGIRRGFSAETDQDLHLNGRHSKGTKMVRDPETGMMYLLKPGSGKQSPAMGAREEGANQSRREAAFWHVADVLGLGNRFPRADLMLIDGEEVAALHLLPFSWKNLEKLKFDDPGLPHRTLEKYRSTGELHKWAILDYLLGNPDRHGQNLMVGPEKDNFPIALIDHGSAFAGPSFDPARDRNSFIPYYLRAWKGDSWKDLNPEQRLRGMPVLPRDTDQQLREWLEGVHAGDVEAVMARYGIDPAPTLQRLVRLKQLLAEPSVSIGINRLWLMT